MLYDLLPHFEKAFILVMSHPNKQAFSTSFPQDLEYKSFNVHSVRSAFCVKPPLPVSYSCGKERLYHTTSIRCVPFARAIFAACFRPGFSAMSRRSGL